VSNSTQPDRQPSPDPAPRLRLVPVLVISLLTLQAILLAYSATKHSPTLNEPGHLAAGLSHLKFQRFEVYCVNPPLVHFAAALPVIIAGHEEDWSAFQETAGSRPEFKLGSDFIKANGKRSIWLFTIARWACIPFSLIGGLFCFFWSRSLWNSNAAGLVTLFLWCFEPNILAHGELITPDAAACAFGAGASFLFWRWLKKPTWSRSVAAGAVMGLALLAKTSWIILFGLWPSLWIFWSFTELGDRLRHVTAPNPGLATADQSPWSPLKQAGQLLALLVLALYVVNLGYGFDHSLTRIKDFTFVSKALTGLPKAGTPGNRFQATWLGEIPVPVPKQFLQGIDLQKKDFEAYGQPSYLRGEWKTGGWWYYYAYGLAVKTPHGFQLMLLLAAATTIAQWRQQSARRAINAAAKPEFTATPRDLVVLLAPAAAVLGLVSSQLEFNHHVRYVLPVLAFSSIFAGGVGRWFNPTVAANSHC
jgi:hypothetical protein